MGVPEVQGYIFFYLYNMRDVLKPGNHQVSVLKWFNTMSVEQIKFHIKKEKGRTAHDVVEIFIKSKCFTLVKVATLDTRDKILKMCANVLNYVDDYALALRHMYRPFYK